MPRTARMVLPAALVVVTCSIMHAETTATARTHGGQFTQEKIANARANVARFEWAQAERDKTVSAAAKWVEVPDEQLWRMVPGQKLPRTIDVTWDYNHPEQPTIGCLECGDKIFKHGNYPYEPDFWNNPWKLTCPSCGAVFPTNDFGKYYESGIDEHGLFDPARGDKSLLFNTAHPDPADPLHKYGVDDGFGYVDKNGRAHKYIGYYAWKYWRELAARGVPALARSFVFTGEQRYAHKAAILIDRIADVYPDMDWNVYALRGWYHSDGRSKKGKIEGSIWEASVIAEVAQAYDAILSGTAGDDELFAFLGAQAQRHKLPPKGTRELFVRNVDDNVLRCARQAVLDERIKGNFGMRQRTMGALALALDQQPETDEWIQWCFEPAGGNLIAGIVGQVDRDGVGNEGAPGYAVSVWVGALGPFADLLAPRRNLYAELPVFRRLFTSGWRMSVLDWTVPNIGDTGATGLISRVASDPQSVLRPFKHAGDPEGAIAAYELNGNKAEGLGKDVYAGDPEAMERRIAEVAREHAGKRRAGGRHLAGYGLASLEAGTGPEGRAVWLYYGRNTGHGHRDRLNFGIYAFGVDLTPDLGYPEFAGGNSEQVDWNDHTISHNTLLVDDEGQQNSWTGYPRFFKRLPGIGAMEIDGGRVYAQASEYSRTMLLIGGPDDAYVVDLLRCKGGKDHLLSFHGPPGEVAVEGLKLVKQEGGTYAGADVQPRTVRSPYSYLANVERDADPPPTFRLDWKAQAGYRGVSAEDDIHLRWHVLTKADEVALADGTPPQNKPGNPKSLRYALLRRTGENLAGKYASVLEPYRATPMLKSVTLVPTSAGEECTAFRVEHVGGGVDLILASTTSAMVTVEPGVQFAGRLGVVRMREGKPVELALIRGTRLQAGEASIQLDAPDYTGKVIAMDEDMEGAGELWVDTPLPTDGSLAGEFISIANDGARSACYEIESVTREGARTKVSCGPVSFVRDMKDPGNPGAGYVLDFAPGAEFRIARHAIFPK
jgi:oligo-alginate lyase